MALNPEAVGNTSEPTERSWEHTDALLYALGVGAGCSTRPASNSNSRPRTRRASRSGCCPRSRRSSARVAGGHAVDRRVRPGDARARRTGHRLHGEIPPAGTVSTVTRVAGIYDKGSAGLVVLESESRHADNGDLAFSAVPPSSFVARVASVGRAILKATRRARWRPSPFQPRAGRTPLLSHATRPGAAVPPQRRPQPSALGPGLRQAGRVRPADPARALHVRLHRPGASPHGLRLGSGAVRRHACSLLEAHHAWRHPHRLGVGHRRRRRGHLPLPHGDPTRRDGDRRRVVQLGRLVHARQSHNFSWSDPDNGRRIQKVPKARRCRVLRGI